MFLKRRKTAGSIQNTSFSLPQTLFGAFAAISDIFMKPKLNALKIAGFPMGKNKKRQIIFSRLPA